MNVLGSRPVSSTPVAGEAPDRRAVEEVAREFEAMLLAQMLQQLRDTLAASEDDEEDGLGLGRQTMAETIDVELARQLSRAGGIGLADELERSLNRFATAGTLGTAATPVGPARLEGAAEPVVNPTPVGRTGNTEPLLMPLEVPQTSSFGWRADPFHGTRRFHAGVDLKATYGSEVPAAGAGTVAFAGEQGGYGLTVLVDHSNGTQTRYAHLSSVSVKAGEQIAQGALVGRVGNSGRSTGPHLHFEVLVAGRPVDPQQVVARLPSGLKVSGEVDD
jgi:murein DD-endopeptidase MepM/ murein hydrolase activator NlpD